MRFILSVRSDFHMTDSQSIAAHGFASRVLMSVSVEETQVSPTKNVNHWLVLWKKNDKG